MTNSGADERKSDLSIVRIRTTIKVMLLIGFCTHGGHDAQSVEVLLRPTVLLINQDNLQPSLHLHLDNGLEA